MKNNNNKYGFKFCPACGAELRSSISKKINEPVRKVCVRCGFIHYQDPRLIASAIIEYDQKLVLVKRGREPEYGKWVFPGGFVDRGETVEFAAIREAEEECGIKIGIDSLLGLYSYPGKIEVAVFFIGRYVSGELIAGDEVSEARLFGSDQIPLDRLAFPSTADALRDYLNREQMK